jgi:structural maintenance of chromosome 4
LVFALHHYKPTPLYVMDEIDAALDFKNVSIVANYIKDRTKNAQFVIISLRNNMFELADRLVGIYKTYDATKSITINPRCFDKTVAGIKHNNEENIMKRNSIVGDKDEIRRSTLMSSSDASQRESEIEPQPLNDTTNTNISQTSLTTV